MSVPTVMSLDAMAIGTPHFAFGDFATRLFDTLRIAHVYRLVVAYVIKMKGVRMSVVSAVDASRRELVLVKPSADFCGSQVFDPIYMLSIAGLLEPSKAPLPALFLGRCRSYSRTILASCRAEFSRGAFCPKCLAALSAGMIGRIDRFPRGHSTTIPEMFYPCKPDIFEATYEPAE